MGLLKAVLFVACGFGVLLASTSAFAQVDNRVFSSDYDYRESFFDSKEGQLEAVWRARIYGEAARLETQSSEVGGFDAFIEAKYQMLEKLEARVFLRGKFQAGHSQSFFGDIEPDTGVFVREAALRYSPFSFLDLKAGVINQDWLEMELLVFRKSFPGGSAHLSHQWTEEFSTSFASQYLIPTSQTLSTRTMDQEPTPTFLTHTASAEWTGESLKIRGRASTFEYKDLPSIVAFESQKRGNSFTVINGPNNSDFQYPFKGWFTQLGVSYHFGLIEPLAYLSVIKNEKAPRTYNDGQLWGVGANFHTTDVVYSLIYENYFAESDVVPGYYNAWGYGNTNKEGYGLDFKANFLKKNFRLRVQYYDAKVINLDPLQQNQQYFFLGVETGYDKI